MTIWPLFVRAYFFILLMMVWYVNIWWLALPFLLYYCYRYSAYEVVLLGILLDVQFKVLPGWPIYTLGALFVWAAMTWLKPRFRSSRATFI